MLVKSLNLFNLFLLGIRTFLRAVDRFFATFRQIHGFGSLETGVTVRFDGLSLIDSIGCCELRNCRFLGIGVFWPFSGKWRGEFVLLGRSEDGNGPLFFLNVLVDLLEILKVANGAH